MTSPLARRFPGTATLRCAGIVALPTPVEPLPVLARELGVRSLWVKRDDLTSSVYGGNKVRKLEYLLGAAMAENRRAVITFGAYGSNHCLATAVHARALGLEPHVVLSPQEPGPFAPATLLAHAGLGTVIHPVADWDSADVGALLTSELAARDGVSPCVIPMGGSSPQGVVGYVNAAIEVADQFRELNADIEAVDLSVYARPDVVYVAAGTLGTAIGLAVGLAAIGAHTRVVALRVTPDGVATEDIAEQLADDTIALLAALDPGFPPLTFDDLEFDLRHDWFEPGYGVVTPETEEAVAIAAASGITLETTYTGKAFAALVADARAGRLSDCQVLFWDTYSSAPMPAPGRIDALPEVLRAYIAQCYRIYPAAATPASQTGRNAQ